MSVDVHAPAPAAHKDKAQSQPAYSLPPSPPLSDEDERAADARLQATADRPRADDVFPDLEFERPLGETELSYFLPSREDGVNDMCVLFSLPCFIFTSVDSLGTWKLTRMFALS